MQSRKSNLVWLLATLFFIFLTGRFHYFFLSDYELLRQAYDARAWWGVQNLIAQPAFRENPTFQFIMEFRTQLDLFWEHLVVLGSEWLDIDRFGLNLSLTTLLHLLTAALFFFLGTMVLRSPGWAFLFAIVVLQMNYGMWMRYPILIPKMLTYSIYPIVLLFTFRVTRSTKDSLALVLLACFGMFLYPMMFVYVMPPLFLTALLGSVFWRWNEGRTVWKPEAQIIISALIWLGALVIMRSLFGGSSREAASLEHFRLFYEALVFQFPKTIVQYLVDYGIYLLICLVGLGISLSERRPDRENDLWKAVQFFGLASLVMMITAVVVHIIALYVPILRLFWAWRIAYYADVPAILCGLALIRLFVPVLLRSGPHSRVVQFWPSLARPRRLTLVASCALLAFVILISPNMITNAKGAVKAWISIAAPQRIAVRDRDLRDLIQAANRISPESRILMPQIRSQGPDTDIFEAEAGRQVLLARSNVILLIVQTEHTEKFVAAIRNYKKIMALKDPYKRMSEMAVFARKHGATHILQPAREFPSVLPDDVAIAYRNSRWTLFRL